MSLEFRPAIKGINLVTSDMQKVTLEIKNGSLDGKLEELSRYVGQTVTLAIVPETFAYKVAYDKESNTPQETYVVNNDGTVDFRKEEQTALEIDGKTTDVELRDFVVDKDVCDAFIKKATSLEFPGNINPRAVLLELEDGEPLSEIAERNEMSETAVMKELDRARAYYAPYADAWNKKRHEVVFADVEPAEETVDVDEEVAEENQEETTAEAIETQEELKAVEETVDEAENLPENEKSEPDPY